MRFLNATKSLLGLGLGVLATAAVATPVTIYDSLGPAVPNLPSVGYEATSTAELGDRIGFAGSARQLDEVTVRMSSWALASTYNTTDASFSHDLTLNIYAAGSGTTPGALIAAKTINASIPYRPEASAGCGAGWLASDGNCYSGLAFDLSFDFSAMGINLPDSIVFGLAYDTGNYGANPTGASGPYNSLNFAMSTGATVGTDVNPDGVFINTSWAGALTTGVTGSFNEDTDWSGYVPAVRVTAEAATVPEPASLALVGLALAGAGFARRRVAGKRC